MLRVAMSAGYASELWHDLFVGVAGAAAALTGLLFVSLSINLQQILKQVWLPRRAGLTVMLLFETLVIAILGLVPARRRLPGAGRAGRGDVPAGDAAVVVAGASLAAGSGVGCSGWCRRSCCCWASGS